MKPVRHSVRWPACLFVLGIVALLAVRLADTEPRFEGRRLSAWLDDPELSEAEIEPAVRGIGPRAIPKLQSWLLQKPSPLERSVQRLGRESDYFGFISFHPSLDANFRGMRGFFLLGDQAAPAIPWLESGAARKDGDFEFYLKALAVCGPEGFAAIQRLNHDLNRRERGALINAFAFGIKQSKGANPLLVRGLAQCLDDPDPKLRLGAIWTVRGLRGQCPPELVASLRQRSREDPDAGLRGTAAILVEELGKEVNVTASTTVPGKDQR